MSYSKRNSVRYDLRKIRKMIIYMDIAISVFIIGLFMGLTPAVFLYADMVRGYDATGGELFIPFVGVFLVMLTNGMLMNYVRKIDRAIKRRTRKRG